MLGGQGHQSSASQTDFSSGSSTSSSASAQIAQDWLDLKAERSLSSFDQRHLLNLQAQYTTGQGLEGGTLLGGWRGRVLKEWTLLTQLNVGTGLPETPVFPVAVPGTGWIGPLAAQSDRRTDIWRPEWRAHECSSLRCTSAGRVGHSRQKLHHRTKPVQSRRRACSAPFAPASTSISTPASMRRTC